MATNEPMSEQTLTMIRELLADDGRQWGDYSPQELYRVGWSAELLLVEVDRLSAREQALAAENAAHREHIASLISQLSDCEAKRDADLEQRLALAAEIAAMRPMVEAVAAGAEYASDLGDVFHCLWCDGEDVEQRDVQHDSNCPVTQARAFVAAHPMSTAAGEAESESE